jgi:hypothetical protein
MEDDSFTTYPFTLDHRGSMVSIEVFGKPLQWSQKTLGWDNFRKSFENGCENPGVVPTPLKCFLNGFVTNGHLGYGGKELVDLEKGIGVSL